MKVTEAIPQLPCFTTHAVVVYAGYSDTCKPADRTSLHDISRQGMKRGSPGFI